MPGSTVPDTGITNTFCPGPSSTVGPAAVHPEKITTRDRKINIRKPATGLDFMDLFLMAVSENGSRKMPKVI
jgi:hypothetical protein